MRIDLNAHVGIKLRPPGALVPFYFHTTTVQLECVPTRVLKSELIMRVDRIPGSTKCRLNNTKMEGRLNSGLKGVQRAELHRSQCSECVEPDLAFPPKGLLGFGD